MAGHAHFFHAIPQRFGPCGPQDVHYHPCTRDGCWRVILGGGADCAGPAAPHERATLTEAGIRRPAAALDRVRVGR